jgi:tetratricopeptide (TPR) repeat protein
MLITNKSSSYAQSIPCDSLKILELYSLFSEYHKNKDYESAIPYGWQVLECDKKKFAKWIYYKMEETLWYLHDSSNIAAEEKKAIEDSILGFYNMAAEYYPDAKGYFLIRKGFIDETWLKDEADEVIKLYEEAIAADSNVSSYYYDRLGELYIANAGESNDYKGKALDLYSKLSEREPDNSVWPQKLENLVENIDELVDLLKKQWDLDPDSAEKAWKYASMAMKANRYEEASAALEFLISKSPESSNYWNQVATAYHKTEQLDKAENAYKKLIQLEPDKKEHYLNLGLIYKDKNQLSAARIQFEKASDVGKGWGLPIYYIGYLYEQAARGCGFEFEDKLVYQLAVDTYKRAKNMDPNLAQAQDRISALSTSVPTKEDYFFRKYKSGDVIPITGSCYGWIGKSVTVP